jgi:hypothetical protein
MHVPDLPPILATGETSQFEGASTVDTTSIDEINAQLKAQPKFVELDTLFHIRQSSPDQKGQWSWHVIMSLVTSALTVLLLFGLVCYAKTKYVRLCDEVAKAPESIPGSSDPTTCHNTPSDQAPENVTFATYDLPARI